MQLGMKLRAPEEEQTTTIHLVERIFEGVDRRGYSVIKASLVTVRGQRLIRPCTTIRMRWILAEDFDTATDHDNHW